MGCTRVDVEFASEEVICRAWLYRPQSPDREQRPVIVMAHGLGGTRDAGLAPYAEKFANAGFVVVLFDYRHFGASDGVPRQLFTVARQLEDWASAIGYARRLDGVDPQRVALWGTSFSGGHVIVSAARDQRIIAVAAQCPMMDAFAAALNMLRYAGLAAFSRLLLFGLVDQLRAMVGMTPLYIPLVAQPGELAAMSSCDSFSGFRAIAPPGFRNQICARYALTIARYRPVAHADRLSCPVLIQVCTKDTLAPPASAVKTARRIGAKAELEHYDCGHFDIYVGEQFERAANEQLAFLSRCCRLPGSSC